MINLISFILACYGMTMILVYGKIFNPIRPTSGFFGDLLKCTMCTGFWVGIFNWMFMTVDFNLLTAGFISSGASYFLSKIVDDDGILFKAKR